MTNAIWKNYDGYKLLVQPSEEMLVEEQKENTINEFEQSLQPSTDEVEQADFEIKIITLLIELGVIS